MELIINIFSLIGSLALFLFGMKTMSEGLEKFAGDRLRSILAAMTKNRVMGVLTGILITALIQSSSATTVMVVSFVNAGLMTLAQSIGVIMGANIGTTVTAWIISAVGFKVNIAAFAIPLLAVGMPLIFSGKFLVSIHGIVVPSRGSNCYEHWRYGGWHAGACASGFVLYYYIVCYRGCAGDYDCTGICGYDGYYADALWYEYSWLWI